MLLLGFPRVFRGITRKPASMPSDPLRVQPRKVKWISPFEVSSLDERHRALVRSAQFEVSVLRRVAACKVCGAQIPKSSVRISYPSTASRNAGHISQGSPVRSDASRAATILCHVHCPRLSCCKSSDRTSCNDYAMCDFKCFAF